VEKVSKKVRIFAPIETAASEINQKTKEGKEIKEEGGGRGGHIRKDIIMFFVETKTSMVRMGVFPY